MLSSRSLLSAADKDHYRKTQPASVWRKSDPVVPSNKGYNYHSCISNSGNITEESKSQRSKCVFWKRQGSFPHEVGSP